MKKPRYFGIIALGYAMLGVVTARAQETPSISATPSSTAAPSAAARDADTLITKEEVAGVQGCAIPSASGHLIAAEPFRVSQCFYTAAETNKSVVVVLMRTNPADAKKRSIREFWEGIFSKFDKDEDEEEKEREEKQREAVKKPGVPAAKVEEENEEEEKRKNPPRRIKDLGDESFWTRSHVNGTLFVLKGEALVRISVGGSEDDDAQIGKCRALAERMLTRL